MISTSDVDVADADVNAIPEDVAAAETCMDGIVVDAAADCVVIKAVVSLPKTVGTKLAVSTCIVAVAASGVVDSVAELVATLLIFVSAFDNAAVVVILALGAAVAVAEILSSSMDAISKGLR